jgi:hypothetical protein
VNKIHLSSIFSNIFHHDLGEGRGRALAETLRLNTTLTSLELTENHMGEGGGRALAETLRLNTTLAKLEVWGNPSVGDDGGREGLGLFLQKVKYAHT